MLLADVVQGKEDHFLGADIGGTNARFYMFATQRRNPMRSELLYEEVFKSRAAGEEDSTAKVRRNRQHRGHSGPLCELQTLRHL